MGDIIKFIVPFIVVCALYFVVTRLWVGLIDTIVALIKRLFKK